MRIVSTYVGQPRPVMGRAALSDHEHMEGAGRGPSSSREPEPGRRCASRPDGARRRQSGLCLRARYLRNLGKSEGRSLKPAAFGENLPLDEFDERGVLVGDVFQVGTATLQATQPAAAKISLARFLFAQRRPLCLHSLRSWTRRTQNFRAGAELRGVKGKSSRPASGPWCRTAGIRNRLASALHR